jgi:branched-chain amino acid transport system substrate-binding protein
VAAAAPPALAGRIGIVLVENRGGSHATEARRGEQGFRLGLEYATNGSLSVAGRDIALVAADDRGDPETAARLLTAAYGDGKADLAVSMGSSAVALATLPVAARFQRVLLIAHGDADAITGPSFNRYVFRTGASASQEAYASVLALGFPELNLAVVAEDSVAGHDVVAALKGALDRLQRGVYFISAHFISPHDPDIGRTVSAEFDALHDLHGAKTLLLMWPAAHPPVAQIAATDPGRFGIRLALCGDLEPGPPSSEGRDAIEGVTSYFYAFPVNPMNDWLVATWRERFHGDPDGFAAEGMTAALALVNALRRAPSAQAEELVAAMEGMSFEAPKGRLTLRREDHQALQPMYHFRTSAHGASKLPQLVREIAMPDLPLPSGSRRE